MRKGSKVPFKGSFKGPCKGFYKCTIRVWGFGVLSTYIVECRVLYLGILLMV